MFWLLTVGGCMVLEFYLRGEEGLRMGVHRQILIVKKLGIQKIVSVIGEIGMAGWRGGKVTFGLGVR
jgi:hypothetical protein